MSVKPPGGSRPLRWAKGLLGRSPSIERCDGERHVARVDLPPRPGAERSASRLLRLREELRARVLVHSSDSQAICNVYLVCKALERGGWADVGTLPRPVLDRALAETEVLRMEEPSPLLALLVEELQSLIEAADAAAAVDLDVDVDAIEPEALLAPEVSEASHEEYAFVERSWVGTAPAELGDEPRLDSR